MTPITAAATAGPARPHAGRPAAGRRTPADAWHPPTPLQMPESARLRLPHGGGAARVRHARPATLLDQFEGSRKPPPRSASPPGADDYGRLPLARRAPP